MNQFKVIRTILSFVNLDSEVDDFVKIHDTIEKDVIFKGTNLWILIFAILVASVGLNMNSTAVIIGAMLISPLMGPINGMGYSIATYDFSLFRKALKNFGFAVVASLLASTTYFIISPISTAHSELLARTSPTIYDVLIAFFGGIAGIIAISSKQKGNVIPGVAIATALMPPLCTAGYGLATAQFNYFFGAFYLFTINTVFIAISSIVVSQVLKFPIRTIIDEAQRKKVNRYISAIIAVVLIPSVYFGYNLVQQEKFIVKAQKYIDHISVIEGNYLLKFEIDAKNKNIALVYGGATLTEAQKDHISLIANNFDLEDVVIEYKQGLSFDKFSQKLTEVDKLKTEILRLNNIIYEKEKAIDSLYNKRENGEILFKELSVLFPDIKSCIVSDALSFSADSKTNRIPVYVVMIKIKSNKPDTVNENKIKEWINLRLQTTNTEVYFNYIK